jgi:heptosyltransferase-1
MASGGRNFMPDILFIKTSSLGDVIHHMPAVTEARRRLPAARLAWIVEEAFAPLVRLHPAVSQVIPVASRRWRRELYRPATWRDIVATRRAIRERVYDEVIDTQGLLRTAVMARLARGRRHGYDADSIRERAASPLYDVRHRVPYDQHAIARNCALTGLALGYAPDAAIDYGLDRRTLAGASQGSYAVLLHATARPEKQWPESSWVALGDALRERVASLILPWGNAIERARSGRVAQALPNARVSEWQPLDGVARLIAGASFVVGVDTGLLHLAAALGVPLTAIFVGSEPGLTGPMGSGPIAIVGGKGQAPTAAEVMAAVERTT